MICMRTPLHVPMHMNMGLLRPYYHNCEMECSYACRAPPQQPSNLQNLPKTCHSCITTIMGAINGIEWSIKAASKGTLWVNVIGRAQASVYMRVSWVINPRNQCWFGFWALTGSIIPKLGFLSPESQDTSQSSGHPLRG